MKEIKSRDDEERRATRIDESRRLEEAIALLRPKTKMFASDPLHIPPEIIPDGWRYCYVRTSILGQYDEKRDGEVKRMGYTPVPADRHPELSVSLFGDNYKGSNNITFGGLTLCEIPQVIYDERMVEMQKRNIEAVKSVEKTTEGMGNDPLMPTRVFANQGTMSHSFNF